MSRSSQQATGVYASRSSLTVLAIVVFLDNLGFAVVLPYLYFYVLHLGGSAFLYGVILAAYSLMSFISTPIVARLSDRFGRRRILIAALAVSSLSYFIFGVANAVWLLFLGRMLSGTTAATVPVAQAYVADVTTPNQRLKYLGYISAVAGVAFVLGPAVGGALSALYGYALPSFLVSALAFSNLVLAYFLLPEPSAFNTKKTLAPFAAVVDVLKKRKIALLLSTYFLFFAAFVFLQATLSPWLKQVFGYGSLQTGLIFFLVGAFSAFSQALLLPTLNKRVNQLTLTLISIGFLTLGLLALAPAANLAYLLVAAVVIAFGFGVEFVTLNTLISVNTPQEAQGGALGIAWAVAGLAQTIAPILGTTAYAIGQSIGVDGLALIISAAISAATFPLFLRFRKISNAKQAA